MAYFKWNDSKIWNIFLFALPTRWEYPPFSAELGVGVFPPPLRKPCVIYENFTTKIV